MATGVNRRVSAASARAHTRNRNRNKPNRESSFPSGILRTALAVLFIGFLAWAYQAIQPPPPKICGSPDGPPITAPRIKLRDGRYMAYKEHGVPRDAAKYKIVFVHGLDCCRHDAVVADTLSPDVVEELGVYIVSFDRPGHGESDPDPNLTVKSQALDIEEFTDKLGLGSKFYIIGYSLGGQIVWGCLKYIPHRLASAALLNPAVNYWWSGLPANLTNEAFYQLKLQDQWVFRVAHYAPWLTYWWNTQQWFPSSSLTAKSTDVYSRQDMELLSKRSYRESFVAQVRQQGEYETVHSGLNFAFGSWEFSPLDLENPFPTNEGSVHIWQGDEDLAIAAKLQPYIAKKLPWIHYHELQGAGHLFPYADGMSDTIIKSLLLGRSKQDEKFGQEKEIGVIGRDTNGILRTALAVLFIGFLAWAYQAIQPPPPKICGSPDGPPITAPRIKLRDGRNLAYKEHGVPRDAAKYKIVFVHGLDSSRHDAVVAETLSPDLGVYIVSFDRPGYGESDPDPNLTVKSIALDIEELADKLGLGSKFYIIGYSLGGQTLWGCLKYIPHRLASAMLLNPVVNYWWSGLPANLTNEAFYQLKLQDQWTYRVAHYAPWLTYWWNTQQWFPSSSVIAGSVDILSRQDLEILSKLSHKENFVAQVRQQGEYETVHRDLNFAFGSWEFSPLDLENPFPNNEGSVHLWQGDEDLMVAAKLQPCIAQKLPWIHYHELQGAGHGFPYVDGMADTIIKSLLQVK